jgi:DnaK suppressor protein
MLSSEQVLQLKEKIKKKLVFIAEDIADLKEATKPIAPENAIGRISRMDAINNKSVNEAALRTSIEKEGKLKHALEIIHTEEFGKCTRCKRDIPFERLFAMPESDKCVQCASM